MRAPTDILFLMDEAHIHRMNSLPSIYYGGVRVQLITNLHRHARRRCRNNGLCGFSLLLTGNFQSNLKDSMLHALFSFLLDRVVLAFMLMII